MKRYLLALAAVLAAASNCGSTEEGPTGTAGALAMPAGTMTLSDRSPSSTTGAPSSDNTGATGAGGSDAGPGFCAQTAVCAENEHFDPSLCNCVPDETGQISDTGV